MQHSCSHSNAICHHSFKKRIELRTQEQPLVAKHIGGTIRDRNDRSRTRRTDEVPFIAGCSHFTRKNTRFRAPASSPTHHFPSSPLPIVTTSHRHHLPSSTSLRHHFPSSPLPIVPTSLPHHSPSSSLPFVTTSHRHHFPSSPLPFVTTSHRHHFPSSPLPFVTTSLRHHPSLSPPFIKVNSTASYSFVMYCYVMYCYVIYHPASFQVAEFYLSVTRKYCFPTSFDNNNDDNNINNFIMCTSLYEYIISYSAITYYNHSVSYSVISYSGCGVPVGRWLGRTRCIHQLKGRYHHGIYIQLLLCKHAHAVQCAMW